MANKNARETRPINLRKDAADLLFNLAAGSDAAMPMADADFEVSRDPTNPYAFVLTKGDASFRVVVKPLVGKSEA